MSTEKQELENQLELLNNENQGISRGTTLQRTMNKQEISRSNKVRKT